MVLYKGYLWQNISYIHYYLFHDFEDVGYTVLEIIEAVLTICVYLYLNQRREDSTEYNYHSYSVKYLKCRKYFHNFLDSMFMLDIHQGRLIIRSKTRLYSQVCGFVPPDGI